MVDSLKEQLTSLEEHYAKLEENYEWLRGEYGLLSVKLLPAAEKIETPWWVRLGRRFKRKKA
jgi:predicted nuclease with TOPRIM domain